MSNLAKKQSTYSGKKILVVDDNAMLLKAWDRMLAHENCTYRLTSSPQEALEWMETEQFDIIISDIVMPVIDGFDLMQAAWRKNPKMQLIFTTAYQCDFHNAPIDSPDGDHNDIHVLLKPYQDLSKVEEFVARVIEEDTTLNQVRPLHSNNDLNFHLWHL